jgi:hypothetical protein
MFFSFMNLFERILFRQICVADFVFDHDTRFYFLLGALLSGPAGTQKETDKPVDNIEEQRVKYQAQQTR